MSLDDLYNYLKVYESEVQKKSKPNSQNMAFISLAKHISGNEEVNTASVSTASTNVSTASANIGVTTISQDTACAYIASQSSGSQIKFEDINQIDEDDMKEMDIKWNMALLSMRADKAPRSQDRGRRDNYKQGSKVEEQAPKALMAINEVGWDWSYMANDEENHALVADEEAPTEFPLMAKTSVESEVFDNSLCSKDCKKNTDSLNSKITDLTDKLFNAKNMIYHYKLGLAQVEARLAEHRDRELKYCEKIRGIEFKTESSADYIESLKKKLELIKKEKEGLDSKLTGFQTALNDLDSLLESQRLDKNKEGLAYSDVPPPPAQIYSPPKKDMSWTGLPEFKDDTVTDYSRHAPTIESSPDDAQNINPFVTETKASSSTISPKSFIKFVKANDSPTDSKTDKAETAKKPLVKKISTGSTKFSTADMGKKGKAIKLSAWHFQNNIDDKGDWDSGYSRHMTGNISYLSDYEPFDGGYVSFGQGGCKITGKGTIKSGKLEFENVYFVKDLKYNLFSVSQICDNKNSILFTDSECIVLGQNFKLSDDDNVLLRTPRQHNMYSIDLNNILPHKDLTCLVVKASADESMSCHRRLGIKREFSNARTPQQNGVAERRSRTLIEAARTMLTDAKLPVTFWAKVVNTACYVQNRIWKFKAKGDEGYFIGYSMSSKAFRVFKKRTERVEENLHVEFLENKAIEKGAGPNWLFDIESLTKSMNYVPADADDCSTDVPKSSGNSNPTDTSTNASADQLETLTVETPIPTVSSPVPTACFTDSQEPSSDTRLISKKVANQVKIPSLDNILTLTSQFEDILGVTTNSVDSDGVEADLSNMETTITACPTPTLKIHKDHPKSKIISHVDTPIQTRNKSKEILVYCPKGVRPIGTKWVLKNKKDERGIVIRNKARLVAQRNTQEEGIDYDEVFVPIVRIEAIRLFLAYASFMGFTDPEFPAKVYKVEKAMYGLHQAPRAWYGEFNFFLGLQVLQKEDGIFLSQDKYLGDILKKFGYSDVRSSNTPMDKENPWGKDGTGKDVDLHLYRSMIGSLMYLTASRPDIMFAVCAYARHQVTPKECHMHAVKRTFRYLKGHPKLGLLYHKESPFDLVAYSDSDYGGATQDYKSTTRGCQFLGRRLISWQCKKLTIMATSTTEIEYVAAANLLTKPFDAGRFQYLVVSIGMSEHNVNFHPIVDFVEASPLRIETTEEGTKILATVDGILRTVTESCLRRNLKLQDKEEISSLPDVELFENLTLMGYNISPYQKFTFQKGTPTEPHHRPSPKAQPISSTTPLLSTLPSVTTAPIPTITPSDIPLLRKYNRRARIAQSSALPPVADESVSPLRDVSQAPRVTSLLLMRAELEINMLKTRVKLLEDREGGVAERSEDDAPIKGRNLDEREAAAERVSDDTEEMATILTSMDAATVLASGVAKVSTGSGSTPTAGPPAAEVPTGSDVVPTAGPIFATATMVTPYTRRKDKETMVESETLKKKKIQEQIDAQVARELEEQIVREDQRMSEQIARDAKITKIHAEEELQIMVDGLDRSNETVAKYLHEYHQFATELPLERRIELISDLIRYQDNYAKVYKFQTQQRKPWSKKQKRDYYMVVIKSNLERFKRKGIRFEQESVKKLKTSEEVHEEVKSPDEVLEEKVGRQLSQLPILRGYVEASGQEGFEPVMGLNDEDQLWTHTQNLMHAPVEWKLYDMCGVHQLTSKDKEIFMLVEKDYPLMKALAIGMISYKLQVETYSKMANDLILKIYKIASSPRQQVLEFPLPEEVPTASEESSHC
nr:hypothetical protein [Tanacetum cinerariifolium]